MHAAPERTQDTHAVVADLVFETFDHDRAIARHDAGCGALFVQVLE